MRMIFPKNKSYKNRAANLLLAALIVFTFSVAVLAQDEDEEQYIVPVRPTASDSAEIQKTGVLQLEFGGDFDFDTPDYRNRQGAPLALRFAAGKRLRLDFEIDAVVSQKDRMGMRETGVGDVRLGFKTVARDKPKERLAVAFAYTIKLPATSENKGLGTGKIDHNLRLIFQRNYDKTSVAFNSSYLNVGREMSSKRDSGAQAIFTVEQELPNRFGFIAEVSGNTVDERLPRGIYLLGAFTYKVNKRLRFDFGARPGIGRDAPRVGVFAGFTAGIGK